MDYLKGRGTQINTQNRFIENTGTQFFPESINKELLFNHNTHLFYDNPKTVVNTIESSDLYVIHSVNTYQGC
jgi:hypothetical protein